MQLEELSNINMDLYEFAKNIVKYQNFKTSAALKLFEYKVSYTTALNYFNLGITYIKIKIKSKSIPMKIYEYIDDAIKKHIQPLTPKESEKRRVNKKMFAKKEATLPIQNALNEIRTEKTLTEKFEYGVKYSDHDIKILNSKHDALIFLSGVSAVSNEFFKPILVSITKLED